MIIILSLGFILLLVFSWMYELTSEGFVKQSAIDSGKKAHLKTSRKFDYVIIGSFIFDPNRIIGARNAAYVRVGIQIKLTAEGLACSRGDLWVCQRTERATTSKYQDLNTEPAECLSQLDANDAWAENSHRPR